MEKFEQELFILVLYFACKAEPGGGLQPTEEGVNKVMQRLIDRDLNNYVISDPDRLSIVQAVDKRLYEDYQDWKRR